MKGRSIDAFFWILISFLVVPKRCSSFLPLPTTTTTTLLQSTRLHAEKSLNIAVVGGGPSGLLLTHLLLQEDDTLKVTLLEGRDDPRIQGTEQRAYALGVGIRGRTAIRQVDEQLWQAVKRRGYESERFQLHIGGFVIPLRSEHDGDTEPSVIIYQSELCAAMTDELEQRYGTEGRLRMRFGTPVTSCDLNSMRITTCTTTSNDGGEKNNLVTEKFDLILGCDGVNSVVRAAMEESFPAFKSTREKLPGEFKVVRLDTVPPKVDPTAVSLILPRKGSVGAFVEPTGSDGSCAILFSGRGDTPILRENSNETAVVEELTAAFPQWEGCHESMAKQLMMQYVTGTASSVVCNIYNFGERSALAGDACHATGGVSGQGVNSALADSVVLAKCIVNSRDNLEAGLLEYSIRQVPEGKALFDLSFGPKPKGVVQRLVWAASRARDTLFGGRFGIGRPPLQRRLTTDLTAFSDIRREIDKFYDDPFPSGAEFRSALTTIHETAQVAITTSK